MARGTKQIEGQLTFDFCLDTGNYVVQANDLITGKQSLQINSAKLIRAAIMQVVYDDKELKPYILTIKDFADLLGVDKSNLYKEADKITDNIIKHPIFFKERQGKKIRWIKIPWVQKCEYQSDVGIMIQLNEELKPYLINLKSHYTQYTLDNVLAMKSVYGIRIFELLQRYTMDRVLPRRGLDIPISIQEIRECCDCEDKYERYSQLKERVLDVATKEINRVTLYHVDYTEEKNGRSVEAIIWNVRSDYTNAVKKH